MSTNSDRTDEDAILDGIDNYKMTLGSMCALAHVLEKHYGAESWIAPAMRPIPRDGITASDPVTPDMLSQGRGINLVVEVKRSLPSGRRGRNAVLGQITKYDGDLAGWKWTPQTHGIILMTHMSKSSQWADFLAESLKRKRISLGKKLAVVEYVCDSERETYFILKMVWGETGNATLNKHLHNSIVVKWKEIIKKISVVRFCDSKPDVAYTLSILWGQVFPALITRDRYLSTTGQKAINYTVDLAKIMGSLRESQGPFFYPPKQQWVYEALDTCVRLKMARRLSGGRFLIYYRPIGGDLVTFFVKKLAKASVVKDRPTSSTTGGGNGDPSIPAAGAWRRDPTQASSAFKGSGRHKELLPKTQAGE